MRPRSLGLTLAQTAPGSGIWTISGKVMAAPGTYCVTIQVSDGNQLSDPQKVTFTVTPEDARATYTGVMLVPINSTSAIVTLAATIQDISAVDPSDTSVGDIRRASVTFINRDTGLPINATPLPVDLVSLSGLRCKDR